MAAAALAVISVALQPRLLAQAPPGVATEPALHAEPVPFGMFASMGVDPFLTLNASFTQDGNRVYFSKSLPGWSSLAIFTSVRRDGKWSEPEIAPFSGQYRDTDPAIDPGGRFAIFASVRPPRGKLPFTYALYKVALGGGGAEALPDSINSGSASTLYPSIARDGTLYFMRVVGKTPRIFRSKLVEGKYGEPEALVLPGDSDTIGDIDPTIAPDQRFVVFASNRADALGGMDIYISFRHGNAWCAPLHFAAPVNGAGAEIATGLSPDARTLYFASSRSALESPRAHPINAAEFEREAQRYDNGQLRTYQADIGPWLDAHAAEAADCKSESAK